ncbi:MAG: hypothetical protein K1X74_08155 [Pirellulales bacterium]|nr:hypothetical protein [Pirellulales bacterium]
MKRSSWIAAGMLAGAALWALVPDSWAGAPKDEDQVSEFMQQKLVHAEAVLEGVVLEDFEQIATEAQKLSLISLDSTWQVLQSDEYAKQSAEFRRTAQAMAKAADEKNLDGSALAYVEMTMKCVKCHKYVRDVKKSNAAKASEK